MTKTGEQFLTPDWSAISLSSLPPFQNSGSVTIDSEQAKWQRGQTPDQVLRLGDLAPALRAEDLTLNAVAEHTGIDLARVALIAFTLAAKQPLGSLVEVVPELADRLVSDVPPIRDLVRAVAGDQKGTIAQVLANNPAIATKELGSIDLSQYPIASIPHLDAVSFKAFQAWDATKASGIPGLGELPLKVFPQPLGDMGNIDALLAFRITDVSPFISPDCCQPFRKRCSVSELWFDNQIACLIHVTPLIFNFNRLVGK